MRHRALAVVMPSLRFGAVVLDVEDFERSARFWTAALGYEIAYRHDWFWALADPENKDRCRIGLQPAETPKRGVNRVHIDLDTDDMEREVARLEGLGATRVDDWPYPDTGPEFTVMRDPDGHEFCIIPR